VWVHESDETRIVSAGDDRLLTISDIFSGAPVQQLSGHTGWIHALAFNGASNEVVTGSGDHTARIWDLRSGTTVHTLTTQTGPVETLLRHGNHLVTGSCDRSVQVYDMRGAPSPLYRVPTPGVVTDLAMQHNTLLCAQAYPSAVSLWDLATGTPMPDLTRLPSEPITCILADNQKTVVGSADCVVRVFDTAGALRASMPLLYRSKTDHIVPHNRNSIRCMVAEEERLVIGSTDWLMRMYTFDR
jgi:WD40 repeat protein